jgi:AraC family transcriptional regulator of adaptative response / DNA-3-methyladenine glycosylase II
MAIDGHAGRVSVFPDRSRTALVAEIDASLGPVLMTVVARLRHLFDLDARPDAVAAVLGPDPILGPLVRARPGLRVPGTADPVEAVARGIVGQQISVKAARTIASRLVRRFGVPVGEHLRFPTAAELAAASIDELAGLGMPGRRAETLRAAAKTLMDGFDLERLSAVPGIGPWTRGYFELRVAHLPDAFPVGDAGLHKALGLDGKAAVQRSEAWRPWRAYAALHLWTSLGDAP